MQKRQKAHAAVPHRAASAGKVEYTASDIDDDCRPEGTRQMIEKIKGHLQERTGIYKLGFDPASFAGIALPVAFVVIVGGILSVMFVFN
jgi:hypothetical protein